MNNDSNNKIDIEKEGQSAITNNSSDGKSASPLVAMRKLCRKELCGLAALYLVVLLSIWLATLIPARTVVKTYDVTEHILAKEMKEMHEQYRKGRTVILQKECVVYQDSNNDISYMTHFAITPSNHYWIIDGTNPNNQWPSYKVHDVFTGSYVFSFSCNAIVDSDRQCILVGDSFCSHYPN